jgi:hypothetical protein
MRVSRGLCRAGVARAPMASGKWQAASPLRGIKGKRLLYQHINNLTGKRKSEDGA